MRKQRWEEEVLKSNFRREYGQMKHQRWEASEKGEKRREEKRRREKFREEKDVEERRSKHTKAPS
jgi:hypothetical protein